MFIMPESHIFKEIERLDPSLKLFRKWRGSSSTTVAQNKLNWSQFQGTT